MTAEAWPERYGHLECNSPVAPWRAGRLVASLAGGAPATIVDIGCGMGAMLLRLASERAAEFRKQADRSRDWLRGHRGLLGFAYLTLGRSVV